MAGKLTGATDKSVGRHVLDSGILVFNYGEANETPAGSTQEGVTFVWEQEMRETEVDGHRGPIVEGRRVISETARITGQLMEMTSDNLARVITAADVTDNGTHKVVRRMSDLPNVDDYLTNVALVARVQGSGQPFIGLLYNALNDGGFELETSDEGEAVMSVQFTAHTPAGDPDTSPWEIRWPKDVDGALGT